MGTAPQSTTREAGDTEQAAERETRSIKEILEVSFGYVRIKGEISGINQASSGHVYLTLKDENAIVNGIIWKSVPRSTHLILVPNGGCLCFNNGPCVSDNWALMSRPTLPIYAEEMHGRHGTPENRLYQNLRRKNVSIWTTGIKTAFQMVRTVEFMKTARHKVVISNKSMQYPVSNLSSLKTRWVHYNETVSFSKRLKC